MVGSKWIINFGHPVGTQLAIIESVEVKFKGPSSCAINITSLSKFFRKKLEYLKIHWVLMKENPNLHQN